VLVEGDPTQSGVFTGILVAGQTYTIGLNGKPNVFTIGAGEDLSGYMDGSFTWAITGSVPEPSTWATLLFGFAGLGITGYRQSKRAPIAV